MASVSVELEVDTYPDAQKAFANRALSRRTNPPEYEDGNILDRVVMLLHGRDHHQRRRAENPLYLGRDNLLYYEKHVLPGLIEPILLHALQAPEGDILEVAGMAAILLSASVAGVDFDEAAVIPAARRLVEFDRIFNDGVGIEEYTGDRDELKLAVQEALRAFDEEFLTPSKNRRTEASIEAPERERHDDGRPVDLLTALLARQEELGLDDGTILREVAFFLESGAHASALTTANTLHCIHLAESAQPYLWERVGASLPLAQRCVHEALRLRPPLPRAWRRAVQDTEVAGRDVREGALVHINIERANRDPSVFGSDADTFNPERELPKGVSLYGLSFSAGMHSCIGRGLAVGFGVMSDDSADPDQHLFGMVPIIVQQLVRHGARPHPSRPPKPLRNFTGRGTRWAEYPFQWDPRAASALV